MRTVTVAIVALTCLGLKPALALEPLSPPKAVQLAPPGEIAIPAAASLIAEGVPISAVLGGEQQDFGWVDALGDEALALGGRDPVSFFEAGGPIRGKPEFATDYHDARFLFASAIHRDQFLRAPELYAPQFGGYDPEALAAGVLLHSVPDQWTVHEGRLFVSGSPELKRAFEQHKPEVIRAAQEKWRAVDAMFEDRFFKAHQD